MGNKLLFGVVYVLCALLLISPGILSDAGAVKPPMIETGDGGTGSLGTNSVPRDETTDATASAEGSETTGSWSGQAGADATVSVYLAKEQRVVEMEMDAYITQVVMAEVPYTFSREALKAQAVAARTYCLYRMQMRIGHGNTEAGICTDYAHCMAYFSEEEAAARWGEDTAKTIHDTVYEAVKATSGEYLTYQGRVIAALFHASSTGRTESAENVWGSAYPYLVSVKSPEEPRISEVKTTVAALTELMKENGEPDFSATLWGEENKIKLSFNTTGRIAKLSLNGYSIKGTVLRSALGLRSTDFSPEVQGDEVIFTVTGYGHGIGMSQYGAEAMAQSGADYRAILTHYYTGTEITGGNGGGHLG